MSGRRGAAAWARRVAGLGVESRPTWRFASVYLAAGQPPLRHTHLQNEGVGLAACLVRKGVCPPRQPATRVYVRMRRQEAGGRRQEAGGRRQEAAYAVRIRWQCLLRQCMLCLSPL